MSAMDAALESVMGMLHICLSWTEGLPFLILCWRVDGEKPRQTGVRGAVKYGMELREILQMGLMFSQSLKSALTEKLNG